MSSITLEAESADITEFVSSEGVPELRRLMGMDCAGTEPLASLRARLADGRSVTKLVFESADSEDNTARIAWRSTEGALLWRSEWRLCGKTGVLSRKDCLVNDGREPISIQRCLARYVLAAGEYEMYSQGGDWCSENRGLWRTLPHGTIQLGSVNGRTTMGGSPYFCLRDHRVGAGLAFHLLPMGNWVARVSLQPPFSVQPIVELGLSDRDLDMTLAPGETCRLPEILTQSLPGGDPREAAPSLHEFMVNDRLGHAQAEIPVVYNCWCDHFDIIDPERLSLQLKAARDVGCDVFVVDAGWFGAEPGEWTDLVGDWRESLDSAFRGKMLEFANEVRETGMGFGIWIEPERVNDGAPIARENPVWVRKVASGGHSYVDMTHPEARQWVRDQFAHLIETYGAVYIKIDFNGDLGPDPHQSELLSYFRDWYALLDEMRSTWPQVFFEGCASGGMRLEFESLSHFDGHLMSDTMNPWTALAIYQEALLRLPPGRLGKFATLRLAQMIRPKIGRPEGAPKDVLVCQRGIGGWNSPETVTLDFAVRVAFCGALTLSGELSGFADETRTRIKHHVEQYKTWRGFMVGAVAHLLTTPIEREQRDSWVAVQLSKPGDERVLVFAYRLTFAAPRFRLRLKELQPECNYAIVCDGQEGQETQPIPSMTGHELMHNGFLANDTGPDSAEMYILTPAPVTSS